MAVVMLDVGSRNGESLEEFTRWPFDVVHAFEPMPEQFANIVERITDPRVVAHNFGLSDVTGTKTMYGSDVHGEASVFASKWDVDSRVSTECEFVEAAEFFRTLPDDATIYMKLNCEGSEVAILHNLLDAGLLDRVSAFRVEFDISRVPDQDGEADRLLARLDECGYDRYTIGSDARIVNGGLVDRVPQVGTHHERLRSWLGSVWRR